MLYEFQNYNKHGNIRTRIIPWPNGKAFGINPKGLGNYIGVRIFKYEYKHELYPPGLIKLKGKKYIVPGWQEVLPETTLQDITWVKPEVKKPKLERNTWEFKSSSSTSIYKVTQVGDKISCNCPGYWVSKTRECKHIKEVKEQL
jgi:hypothetical protein